MHTITYIKGFVQLRRQVVLTIAILVYTSCFIIMPRRRGGVDDREESTTERGEAARERDRNGRRGARVDRESRNGRGSRNPREE